MPLKRANVIAVACNVRDCKAVDQFLLPCDLQDTGWLEVFRLGDSSTMKRAYLCPQHAKQLEIVGFEDSPDAYKTEQGFNRLDRVPFIREVFPELTPQLLKTLLPGVTEQELPQLGNGEKKDGSKH